MTIPKNRERNSVLRFANGIISQATHDRDALVRQVAGERRTDLRLGLRQKTAAEDKRHLDAGACKGLRKLGSNVTAADHDHRPWQLR